MNARQIIDRLAALDEATVAEPEIDEPIVEPQAPPAPSRPGRQPSRQPSPDPWSVPPDFEPGQMPRPKAEGDESGAIEAWLEATQQPIQDWEWDGQELRLLMQDGSTEGYTREQLDEIGVFGQMAMAESEEPGDRPEPADDEKGDESETGSEGADELTLDEPLEGPEDATGTLDAILGRTPGCSSCEQGEEVIQVQGDAAEKLTQAVSDVVGAILGVVDQAAGGDGTAGGAERTSDYEDFYAKKEGESEESGKDDEGKKSKKPKKEKKDEGEKPEESGKDDDDKEDKSEKDDEE